LTNRFRSSNGVREIIGDTADDSIQKALNSVIPWCGASTSLLPSSNST
jgi:hypothetical protein